MSSEIEIGDLVEGPLSSPIKGIVYNITQGKVCVMSLEESVHPGIPCCWSLLVEDVVLVQKALISDVCLVLMQLEASSMSRASL